MGKLHEILAVEPDREGIANKIMQETQQVFKSKHNLFQGGEKQLKMLEDTEDAKAVEEAASERQIMQTTVQDRLDYTQEAIVNWLDTVFQKEVTNQTNAKADLIVDGQTLATDVPATFLLGLETKLKAIRNMYFQIPTLAPGVEWEEAFDEGDGVFRAKDVEIRSKTAKQIKSRVLYEATKEHPAQIEKWTEDSVVGHFRTSVTSSMLPAAEKAAILGRIDKLIQATKQARQRANNVDATDAKIASAIFGYINS